MGLLSDLLKEFPALSVAKERLALLEDRLRTLEKANELLKDRNEELEKENKKMQSQLKSPPEARLDEDEIKILKFFTRINNEIGVEASVVSQRLSLHKDRAEYYLQKMADAELVFQSLFYGQSPLYGLNHKGREFLIKNNLLE